ncbi:SDR family oxidoreductase [Cohnella endophytica]|uniref:dTDP-4-dehydrorhamnose reductase n=1 Tax=Cohnella endophytica TaxID=2419778 RepID=A0A494XB37_9BACL|nr:SDR family oxidoreductase [Cohnella endophytica]RKP47242.1 SDR family oxidoreductase [Cohnella endophytica]
MEILVLGAGGMAGHMISIYLREQGHQVTGYSRKSLSYCDTFIGDAFHQETIVEAIRSKPYDAVVNAIGVLNRAVDHNLSEAILLNSYLPHFLADRLRNSATRLIHLSTDCVFSGRTGNYHENSVKDGETQYDRTKALGEVIDSTNLTIRTSIIGPDRSESGIGLLNWFLKQKGPVNGYSSAIWTGVTTHTLAQAIQAALMEQLTGLYHLVNNSKISKFELLSLFNRVLKLEPIDILPSDAVKLDKSLVNNRTDFSFRVPSYEEMLEQLKEWIDAHQELYPHYY